MITIGRRWTFEAAHHLPHVPDGHPCKRVHGHSYTVELEVRGSIVEPEGWICDFGRLDAAWIPVFTRLDHRDLNEVLTNPTSEHLAVWIAERIEAELAILRDTRNVWVVRVRVAETTRSWAEWTP